MKLLGIAGTDGAGKTTLANNWLQSIEGPKAHVNFADALRQEMLAMMSTSIDFEECKKSIFAKPTPPAARLLLRGYGDFRRSLNPDYWVDLWRNFVRVAGFHGSRPPAIACSDVRYVNEALAILELGGTLVYLNDLSKPLDSLTDGEAHELAEVRKLASIELAVNSKAGVWTSVACLREAGF